MAGKSEPRSSFTDRPRRPKPLTLVLIGLAHIVVLYGIAKALAPDVTAGVEDTVLEAFTITPTVPDNPPPEAEPEPDEGAQGAPGKRATPKPVTAPDPAIPAARPSPVPRASSTGTQNRSGAQDEGAGTGAAGTGTGTGSGRGGGGRGGIAVTKPVHISGGINAASDYPIPEGGRQARIGTSVIVKVTVQPSGRAADCSVYRASPDPQADRITCQLVVERLRFEPARDANGDAVAAPFYWQQKWF